nr:hypothetical protein [Tanacetum cinerariifolium]
MVKSSSSLKNEVFYDFFCSTSCKKNTESLNTKITELSKKLSDSKTMLYHYKLGLSQVEARLVEFKNQEIKFCEKIRGLEFNVECKNNRIERLTNEPEELKKEKKGFESKLTGFEPSPSIESNSSDLQNSNSSVSEPGESSESIMSKPMIKFVKAADCVDVKTNKVEAARKPFVKYAKILRSVMAWVPRRSNFLMRRATHGQKEAERVAPADELPLLIEDQINININAN